MSFGISSLCSCMLGGVGGVETVGMGLTAAFEEEEAAAELAEVTEEDEELEEDELVTVVVDAGVSKGCSGRGG